MDRDKGVRCGAAVLRCARWLAHFAPRKLDSYLKTEREEMVSWKLERNSAGSTLFLQLDGDKLRGGKARGGRQGTETAQAGFRQGSAMMCVRVRVRQAGGG